MYQKTKLQLLHSLQQTEVRVVSMSVMYMADLWNSPGFCCCGTLVKTLSGHSEESWICSPQFCTGIHIWRLNPDWLVFHFLIVKMCSLIRPGCDNWKLRKGFIYSSSQIACCWPWAGHIHLLFSARAQGEDSESWEPPVWATMVQLKCFLPT